MKPTPVTLPYVLERLGDTEVVDYLKKCPSRTFREKSLLMAEGDPVAYLPIVLKGCLKVTREDENGREVLLYEVKEGETCILSLTSGIFNEPSRVSISAMDGASVLLIPSAQVSEWIETQPSWRKLVMKICHLKVMSLVRVVDSMSFQTTSERILHRLEEAAQAGLTEIRITHQQMASELGTAREVISRLLKKMENEGQIEIQRGKIRLINIGKKLTN